jgi:hypothetical protein
VIVNLPAWLAIVTASEVIAIGGMLGVGARVMLRSVQRMRDQVQQLATYVAVDKATGPAQVQRITALEALTGTNTARILVLEDWRAGHDMRHTQRGQ